MKHRKSRRIPLATWVPTADVLSPGAHEVLCSDLEGIWIGTYNADEWRHDDEPVDVVVTHWQELPELPEEVA